MNIKDKKIKNTDDDGGEKKNNRQSVVRQIKLLKAGKYR